MKKKIKQIKEKIFTFTIEYKSDVEFILFKEKGEAEPFLLELKDGMKMKIEKKANFKKSLTLKNIKELGIKKVRVKEIKYVIQRRKV